MERAGMDRRPPDAGFRRRATRTATRSCGGSEEVFLTRTTEGWLERLSGVLPCAPVNDVAGALASDFAVRRAHGAGGGPSRAGHGCAWCASRSRWTAPSCRANAAPALGADTAAILTELGYDSDEIEALEVDGTVHRARQA